MTKNIAAGEHQLIKVDPRIVTLINNGVEARHRSMFVVIGDKSCYRVKEMHYLLGKAMVKSRPSVLWCYKNNLDISSNMKKRRRQVKSKLEKGLLDRDTADSFTLFLETTAITYCLYRESERVLGNTYDMCVLQDFEALNPNLLARTIETVAGGGVIMILLRTLSSLTSFYTMVMDVQKRYRTESHNLTSGRFNERFMLSLASCKACIVMDDEVHILPISSHMKTIIPFSASKDANGLSEADRELKDLKEQVHDDFLVGPLIRKCCTMDQAKGLLAFLDVILEKSLGSTIALLASRGRGKSATLGLAIAGAVAAGYSNIFVTAPGPENLKTLFEFVCVGLNLLNYKKSLDYDVVESNNPKFKKATVVQITIKKPQHRQTIQYIQPHEHQKLSQVELLVIDEAATIPLPTVKSLLGPYLVFLSSTVNGYEGTGRSLSLKLLKQLEEQNHTLTTSTEIGRHFKKVTLSESVRYASGDPVESWLSSLLCLDVSDTVPIIGKLPPPSECELYYVNRDTLFSYHKDSELFLQRMMGLYVASHYKNSPNDLQLIADAPAHHLFVLLGPVDESSNILPDILCVIQICFEGQISHESVLKRLGDGEVPNGDQIPWKFCEQFRDTSFPSLSGARIVRIATHPSAMRLGYGSAAVELLARYFEGQLTVASELDSVKDPEEAPLNIVEAAEKASLQEETIKPRNDLPPLLVPLRERQPEKLHYLGVSFGLTLDLFRFWRRHKFAPFYIGSVPNPVTGEYTCMVLKALNNDDIETDGTDQFGFFSVFYKAFKKNFTKYLNRSFRQMEYKLAMSILDPKISFPEVYPSSSSPGLSLASVSEMLSTTTERLKLEDYTNNRVQHHAIEGFIDDLACAYFWEKIPVTLSYLQASVLLCFGLQAKEISKIQEEMGLEEHRIKGFLKDAVKKFKKYFESKESHHPNDKVMEPHPISVDEDLNDGSKQVQEKDYSEMQASIMDEPEKSFPGVSSKVVPGMLVSIKSDRSVLQRHEKKQSTTKSKRLLPHKSNSSKKRKSG